MVRRFTKREVASRDLPRIFVVGSVFVWTYKNLDSGVAGSFYGRTVGPTTFAVGAETAIRARSSGALTDAYDAALPSSTTFLFYGAGHVSHDARPDRWPNVRPRELRGLHACPNARTEVARLRHAWRRRVGRMGGRVGDDAPASSRRGFCSRFGGDRGARLAPSGPP